MQPSSRSFYQLGLHGNGRSLKRSFSTSPASYAVSPLFALGALSNSRESKWLSKASGLSPVEFSPQLQLIRSSEGLDPKLHKIVTVKESQKHSSKRLRQRSRAGVDAHALRIGYAVLDKHDKAVERFQRATRVMRAKHQKQIGAWQNLSNKLAKENRIASFWVVLSIGVATMAALWKVAPRTGPLDINDKAQSLWQSRMLKPSNTRRQHVDDATPMNSSPVSDSFDDIPVSPSILDETTDRSISTNRGFRAWLWADP